MDPEINQLRRNLNTFTLAELKKEVIKMKAGKFAFTKMKRNQAVYDICRLQTADCRLQTADRRLQTADCMRQQDCKLNETKKIVIKVPSSSTFPCSEKYM